MINRERHYVGDFQKICDFVRPGQVKKLICSEYLDSQFLKTQVSGPVILQILQTLTH